MSDRAETPEPAAQVADAPADNWVDRYAPTAARPYLRLSRADRPIGTWLLLIPCWWGLALAVTADPAGAGWFDLWIAVGCALGAFVMRGAGRTWNDITDREFDAQVARTKSRYFFCVFIYISRQVGEIAKRMAEIVPRSSKKSECICGS